MTVGNAQYLMNTGGNGYNCGIYYGNVSCVLEDAPISTRMCCSQRGICGSTVDHCNWNGPFVRNIEGTDVVCEQEGLMRQIDGHDEICVRGVWCWGNDASLNMNTNTNTPLQSSDAVVDNGAPTGSDSATGSAEGRIESEMDSKAKDSGDLYDPVASSTNSPNTAYDGLPQRSAQTSTDGNQANSVAGIVASLLALIPALAVTLF